MTIYKLYKCSSIQIINREYRNSKLYVNYLPPLFCALAINLET